MAQYYYLMAQLPSITFSSTPPFTFEEFKELSFRYINKKDKAILSELSLEPRRDKAKAKRVFLQKWYDFEIALRLALRELRATKLKWDDVNISYEEKAKVNLSYYAKTLASQAFSMEDPLQAELFLDKKRFEYLGQIKSGDSFSSDALFSYALMLLILIREDAFSKEIGREEYKRLYSKILDASKSS